MRTLGYEDAEKFHRQINSRPAGRGLNVVTLALREPTYLSCDLVEAIGSHYVHQQDDPGGCPAKYRPFGLMFEAMGALGKSGVLILSSVMADAYPTRTTWYGGITTRVRRCNSNAHRCARTGSSNPEPPFVGSPLLPLTTWMR